MSIHNFFETIKHFQKAQTTFSIVENIFGYFWFWVFLLLLEMSFTIAFDSIRFCQTEIIYKCVQCGSSVSGEILQGLSHTASCTVVKVIANVHPVL